MNHNMDANDIQKIIRHLSQDENPIKIAPGNNVKDKLADYVSVETNYQVRTKLETLLPVVSEMLVEYGRRGISLVLQQKVVDSIVRHLPIWLVIARDKEIVWERKRTLDDVNAQTEKYKNLYADVIKNPRNPLDTLRELGEFLNIPNAQNRTIREGRIRSMIKEHIDEKVRKFYSSKFFKISNEGNLNPVFDKGNDVVELGGSLYPLSIVAVLGARSEQDIENLGIKPIE